MKTLNMSIMNLYAELENIFRQQILDPTFRTPQCHNR